jgi:hypothetical protein
MGDTKYNLHTLLEAYLCIVAWFYVLHSSCPSPSIFVILSPT